MSTAKPNHRHKPSDKEVCAHEVCVGGGGARPAAEMLRFVKGPDGGIYLDIHQKLEGQGAYLVPEPAAVNTALNTNALSDALSAGVIADPEAFKADIYHILLKSFFDRLGISRKAGHTIFGSDKAFEAARNGEVFRFFCPEDTGSDTRKKLRNTAHKCNVPLDSCGLKPQWAEFLKKDNVTVAALTAPDDAVALGNLYNMVQAFRS